MISQAGGPLYEILKGRKDGRRSKIEDTVGLPSPASNSTELIQAFGKHGFTVQDLVALSGKPVPTSYIHKRKKKSCTGTEHSGIMVNFLCQGHTHWA